MIYNLTTLKRYQDFLSESQNLNLIISLTRHCVLKCKYCYVRDSKYSSKNKIISYETLKKIIYDAFDVRHKHIYFEWTGGESLLSGKSFYERVLNLQKKYRRNNKTYSNGLQTSGAIYHEKLYDFLINNKIKISLTLDGPKKLHEDQRPSCIKNGFNNVLKSYEYLRKKQGWCGILCTITKNSLPCVEEIINFYRTNNINDWATNAYLFDGKKPVGDKRLALSPDEIKSYFIQQFEYFLKSGAKKADEAYLDSIMKLLCKIETNRICSQGGRCLTNFVNIDDQGNATLCPKFIGNKAFCFGNINKTPLNDLISFDNAVIKRLIRERYKATSDCEKKCDYFNLCKGGCAYHSYLNSKNHSVSNKNIMCDSKYNLFKHIDEGLKSHGINTITSKNKSRRCYV